MEGVTRTFDWGWLDISTVTCITQEIFIDRIYEKYREVKEDDIVMDIGANVGAFTASILRKNPRRVFAVEPSNSLINALWNNTKSELVTYVNYAIADKDEKNVFIGPENVDTVYIYNNVGSYFNTMTFSTLVNKHKIEYVDFMKIDCEGGEYSVFNAENKEYILNNVKHVAGEWHLSHIPAFVKQFKEFRELYLKDHQNYCVLDRYERDVTKYIFDDEFIDGYNAHARGGAQFLLYMNND